MGDESMAQIELLRANTKRNNDDDNNASTSDAEDNSCDDVEDLGSNSKTTPVTLRTWILILTHFYMAEFQKRLSSDRSEHHD
jgi:hypothetical protein